MKKQECRAAADGTKKIKPNKPQAFIFAFQHRVPWPSVPRVTSKNHQCIRGCSDRGSGGAQGHSAAPTGSPGCGSAGQWSGHPRSRLQRAEGRSGPEAWVRVPVSLRGLYGSVTHPGFNLTADNPLHCPQWLCSWSLLPAISEVLAGRASRRE